MDLTTAADLFNRLDRELWVVTAGDGLKRGGLIATFVSQASIAPEQPRVLIGLARRHHTRLLIESSHSFGLHLIGEEHLEWVWRFGLASGHETDKLEGLATRQGPTGTPILTDALGCLDCRVEASLDTGDRTLYLAAVAEARSSPPRPLLTRRKMLELAPPVRRRELKEQMDRDAAIDAAAIDAWRRGARGDPIPQPVRS